MALCGVPSLLTKFMMMFALGGTRRAPSPLRYPLKLNGPAMSWKVTVLVEASYDNPSPALRAAWAEAVPVSTPSSRIRSDATGISSLMQVRGCDTTADDVPKNGDMPMKAL